MAKQKSDRLYHVEKRDLYYALETNIERLEKAAKGKGKHKEAAKARLAYLKRQQKKTPDSELKALARKANNRLRNIESAGLVSSSPAYTGIVYTKKNSKNRNIVFTSSGVPEFRTDIENMTAEQKETLKQFVDRWLDLETSTITGIKKRIDKKMKQAGVDIKGNTQVYQYFEIIYAELIRLGYISQEADTATEELQAYFSEGGYDELAGVPEWVRQSMLNFAAGSHPALVKLKDLWDNITGGGDDYSDLEINWNDWDDN